MTVSVSVSAIVELGQRLDLLFTDVLHSDVQVEQLAQLQQVHRGHFPDHLHVAEEMALAWEHGSHDPEVVVHAWLITRSGQPVGEYIFHTNLRRGIVLRHFLAIDAAVRADFPRGWLSDLVAWVEAVGAADCAAHGRPFLGMTGEISAQYLPGWFRMGHRTMDVGYLEPYHGKHWAEYGEPVFFEMTPTLKVSDYGLTVPLSCVATAAVSAFLLDHYRLPPEHPVVAGILARAAALTD